MHAFITIKGVYHNKRSYSDITCVCICLYETTFVIKFTSGRVHPMGIPWNY